MATAKKVEELSRQVREKESELSEARGKLDATEQEAKEKYGTDQVKELEKKKQKLEKEKEKLEDKKQELENEIENELKEIEKEDDDE